METTYGKLRETRKIIHLNYEAWKEKQCENFAKFLIKIKDEEELKKEVLHIINSVEQTIQRQGEMNKTLEKAEHFISLVA